MIVFLIEIAIYVILTAFKAVKSRVHTSFTNDFIKFATNVIINFDVLFLFLLNEIYPLVSFFHVICVHSLFDSFI